MVYLVYLYNQVQEPKDWSSTIRYRNLRPGLPGLPQSGTGNYDLVYLAHNQVQETKPSLHGLPQPGKGNYSLVYLVYHNQVQETTAWYTCTARYLQPGLTAQPGTYGMVYLVNHNQVQETTAWYTCTARYLPPGLTAQSGT